MLSYLRTYRPLNLLLIGIAQVLVAYFLDFDASLSSLLEGGLHFLIGGTMALASFGYWVNDYYDTERDAINKPGVNQVGYYSKNFLMVHLLLFLSVLLYCGNALGARFILAFLWSDGRPVVVQFQAEGCSFSGECDHWILQLLLHSPGGMVIQGHRRTAFVAFCISGAAC